MAKEQKMYQIRVDNLPPCYTMADSTDRLFSWGAEVVRVFDHLKITTNRYSPGTRRVSCAAVECKNYEITYRSIFENKEFTPRYASLTREEYDREVTRIMDGVPEALHSYVHAQLHERNSPNMDEALGCLQSIVEGLTAAFSKYLSSKK